jgi:hypothetical protein
MLPGCAEKVVSHLCKLKLKDSQISEYQDCPAEYGGHGEGPNFLIDDWPAGNDVEGIRFRFHALASFPACAGPAVILCRGLLTHSEIAWIGMLWDHAIPRLDHTYQLGT